MRNLWEKAAGKNGIHIHNFPPLETRAPNVAMYDNGQSGNAQPESLIHLRPMDLGDILDGTIRVYRSRPWLFVSIIAVLAGIPMAIIQISGLQISEYAAGFDTMGSISCTWRDR